MSKWYTWSIGIVSLVIGIGIGYTLTPSYGQQDAMMAGFGRADRYVDLRYINTMIAHHRGAMLLADQINGKAVRAELNTLATEILANEPKLIDELYTWKRDWYNDRSSVADPKVARLGEKDEKIDLRFLNALIAHHGDGIVMTKEIRAKSSRADILNNADAVEQFLTTTGSALRGWRKDWYSVE